MKDYDSAPWPRCLVSREAYDKHIESLPYRQASHILKPDVITEMKRRGVIADHNRLRMAKEALGLEIVKHGTRFVWSPEQIDAAMHYLAGRGYLTAYAVTCQAFGIAYDDLIREAADCADQLVHDVDYDTLATDEARFVYNECNDRQKFARGLGVLDITFCAPPKATVVINFPECIEQEAV